MAETKAKKASGSKAKAAKAKRASPKKKPSGAKSSSAKPSAKSSSSNGSGASARKPSSNGHAPSRKAMIPLVAGGAALAGTVGGVLIGASRSGSKVLGVSLPHPKRVQFKVDSGDLARAAKQVGRFGENVGELTAELKRAREGLAGDNKHSSPVEVLLRGLTARC
jgi:hypothetical protein